MHAPIPQQFHTQALSAKLSGRILKAAREQQEEIDAEGEEGEDGDVVGQVSTHASRPHSALRL